MTKAMPDYRQLAALKPREGHWDAALQADVGRLNADLLHWLRDSYAAGLLAQSPLARLRDRWGRLPPGRLDPLADCPYLLLDGAFDDADRWRGHRPALRKNSAREALFAGARGAGVLRRHLVFAWHLAKSNPFAARLALGMTEEVGQLLALRHLSDIESIAATPPEWIRVHWEDRLEIWEQLLDVAVDGSADRLRQLQVRGMQLLAAREFAHE